MIPTEQLAARDELVDLRISAFAKRPRVQSAFAIRCENWPDFKDLQAVNELQLEWLPFRLTHEDAARFEPQFVLLDARSDETAGIDPWLLLDDSAKFSDEAAKYLSGPQSDPAAFFAAMGIIQGDGHCRRISAIVIFHHERIPFRNGTALLSNH